ncbi:helix-turn-helix domain-containing protein [Heyndrickxia coagulans]|uniref:helix-turn-helix domain-containing protein n=1 Tax=Heyndrickxia coagulans TaxID=1398 RepID=UPI0007790014|nr:helix-turn-helix domain-containing protein [Heyndrickxia coagulans]
MISYKKFKEMIERKGITLHDLMRKGVITDQAYRSISKEKPVRLDQIDAICQYLDLPIEKVVEIIKDEKC